MKIVMNISEDAMCALPELLAVDEYQVSGSNIRMTEIQFLVRTKKLPPLSAQELDVYKMIYAAQNEDNKVIAENMFEVEAINKLENIVCKHFTSKG